MFILDKILDIGLIIITGVSLAILLIEIVILFLVLGVILIPLILSGVLWLF
jgi:hypothetical protein